MDHYDDFFKPTLARYGYKGQWEKKHGVGALWPFPFLAYWVFMLIHPYYAGQNLDGVGIFFRDTIESVDFKVTSAVPAGKSGAQVAVLAKLRHKETGKVEIYRLQCLHVIGPLATSTVT